MEGLLKKIQTSLQDLPLGKKMAILLLIVLSIAGTILVGVWAKQPDFQILYSNLSPEDSAEIVTRLNQQQIPYNMAANGKTIMVPSKNVYKLRMEMAAGGIPQGGNVGFEIFDQTKFGVSDFVQKLNFKRALQGELSRTINQLAEVESSRIHIVTPEKSLFIEDQKKTTASVMLKLKGAKKIKESQVRGIVHLVASSVEGLDSGEITVIDVHGNILFGGQAQSEAAKLSGTQFEFRQNLEKGIERDIQSMLEKVVGSGNVVVRVTAKVDFKVVDQTEENFNPDSQVARSEQRTEENSKGGIGVPAGISGVSANIPGASGGAVGSGGTQSQRTKETINYEINKVVKHIVNPVGEIENLSVAVIVDGSYEGEGKDKKFIPRTTEEIERYNNLVKTAVGFDEARGDEVKVENIQFKIINMEFEEKALAEEAKKEFYFRIGKYVFAFIIVLLLLIFIIRPLIKWVTEMNVPLESVVVGAEGEAVHVAGGEGEAAEEVEGFKEKTPYRRKVQEMVSSDPERATELVRKWIKEAK